MVSWSSARDASAALRMTCSGAVPSTQNGSPSVNLFWVSVPVLSEQSTSIPASSSMAASRLTIACFAASTRAPTAIVTDSTVGIATGIAATVNTNANCKGGDHPIPAEQRDGENQDHQHHRQHDQVIADLQHGALEMADGVRLLHQLCGLAEVSVLARAIDQRVRSALADDRSRVDRFAGLARHRQRLAGQRGLIHFHRVAFQAGGRPPARYRRDGFE